MDAEVVKTLEDAGMDTRFERCPLHIAILMGSEDNDRPVPLDDDDSVLVVCGEDTCEVRLRPIAQLFSGDARPPDFARGPAALPRGASPSE